MPARPARKEASIFALLEALRYRSIRMRHRLVTPAAAALLVTGCQLAGPPDLVKVDRLDPVRASAGDRVTITGDGFPAGRPATVLFRGDLFRPGAEARRGVQIRLDAVPDGRNSLSLKFDPEAERRFVGTGETAAHTTFHGDVRVVFQPGRSGLTEVSGAARNTRFDVLPSGEESSTLQPRPDLGSRALAFLGMSATPDPAGGLRITAVDPGGRAALCGVAPGDLLIDLDGVTVLSIDDLSVRGGERRAHATIERGTETRSLDLDVQGLSPMGPATWTAPAVGILAACALLAAPMTPLGLALRWLGRLLGARSTPDRRSQSSGWSSGLGRGRALPAAAILVLFAVSAAFARLSLGRPILSADLDLLAAVLCASITLVISRIIHGASVAFSRAAAEGIRTLCFVLPAIGAVIGTVVAGSRFVISEIVSAQGGVPWRWAAMQNPGLLILSSLLVASAIPEAVESPSLPEVAGVESVKPPFSPITVLVRLSEWAYLWVTCGLATLLFFGGYRVPGVSTSVQETGRFLVLLGAGLFFLKLCALVFTIRAIRFVAGGVLLRHVALPWARFALPACIAGTVLAAAWATLLETTSSNALADLSGVVSVVTISVAGIAAMLLFRRAPAASNLAVNPWL